jgi:uncharacterized protein
LVRQGGHIKIGESGISSMRNWTKTGLALMLMVSAAPALSQGYGMNASEGEAFLNALKAGDAAKAVPMIKDPGSRVANYRGYSGDTPLIVVTRKRDLDWVGFLLNKGADPNIGDNQGDTPLMLAARMGFEEAATYMLQSGAKVDLANRRGETALNVAVQQRQPRLVELLLRAGANPDKADHTAGLTPRDYAKRDTRNPQMLKMIETIKSTKKPVTGPSIN